MLTITPSFCSSIIFAATSRVQRKTEVRLTSITACHCARLSLWISPSLTLSSRPSRRMPALLIRPCRAPKSLATCCTICSTCASSATLQI
ncbi:hypothetical protein D3C78_1676940 [compost metagenome]